MPAEDVAMPPTSKRIAAAVVLYHPDNKVPGNINSYVDQVDIVFAIDNTEQGQNNDKIRNSLLENPKIIYIANRENLGIAAALNIGANHALQAGYSFLLTMDQDSAASPTLVADLTDGTHGFVIGEIGILSPFHSIKTDPCPPTDKTVQVLTAWTSGSLLNLSAYLKTGPFTEKLFIDFVDHEYCLRLNLEGYKILKVNKAILTHNFGIDLKRHRFLWKHPVASNHSALRRYYITRNRFYIASQFHKKFPDFFRDDLILFFKEIAVIFLFEKDVFRKYKMILRGFYAYKRGILGKYQDIHHQGHSCPPPRLSS